MKTVSVHDAKTNLSKYIAAAKRGETITIGSFGKPEVTISIYEPKPNERNHSFGLSKTLLELRQILANPAGDEPLSKREKLIVPQIAKKYGIR